MRTPRRNHTSIRTRLTTAQAIAEFYDVLLPDPDPASMQIAQDLCETYGLKLADLGEQMAKNGFENKCWTDTNGWADADVSAGEFVISQTRSPFRVLMRPPSRGERGWWVSSRKSEEALVELLVNADNTEGSLGWIAPEDFDERPDENDMIAVTVERDPEFMATWWSIYHRPLRAQLHHSVQGRGGGYRIGLGAWYGGKQWDEGRYGIHGVQMTEEEWAASAYQAGDVADADPYFIDKNKRSLPKDAKGLQPIVLKETFPQLQTARREATRLAWSMAKVLKEGRAHGQTPMEVAVYLRELVFAKGYMPPRAITNPKKGGDLGSLFGGLAELATELNPGEATPPSGPADRLWAVQYRNAPGGIAFWQHVGGPDRAWVEQWFRKLHRPYQIMSIVELRGNPPRSSAKPRTVYAQKIVAKYQKDRPEFASMVIGSPEDVARSIHTYLGDNVHESFVIIFVNIRNKLLGFAEFTEGGIAGVGVDASGVFREALAIGAAGIVTVHNHPSGDPTPSAEDYALWARLREAGKLVGIPVVDNMVVGKNRYFSQAQETTGDL